MNFASITAWVFQIIYLLFIARVILSFMRPSPDQNKTVYEISEVVFQLTEPLLAPIRKALFSLGLGGGMVDFSPLIALILLGMIRRILLSMAYGL